VLNEGRVISGEIPVDDDARAWADRAAELAPDLPEALDAKGTFSSEQECRALYERALALDPSRSSAWAALANWGWQNGDNVGGAVAGRRAVQLGRNEAGAAGHLAYSLAFAEMYDEAAIWFERVLEGDPSDLYALISMTWFSTVNRDYPSAHRWAARALEASADNGLVLWSVAQLEIAEGDLEAAANTLGEIVKSQPNLSINGTPSAQVLLGWVLAESSSSEGQEQLERLQELRLESATAGRAWEGTYRDLSVIASVLGTPDEQLRWFLEASRVDEGRALYHMARDAPWLDPIRNTAEFQAWLEDEAEELAA